MNRRAYKTSVLIFLLSTCTSLGSLSLAQTFDDPFIIYSEDTIYKGSIVDNTIKDSLYYGKNITQDVYTKPDVIITDKSNIKTSNFNHAKYFEYGELREKQGKSFDLSEEFRTCSGTVGNLNDYLLNYKEQLLNVPQNMSHIMYREWYFATSDVKYNV